jgi:hypothetical protein
MTKPLVERIEEFLREESEGKWPSTPPAVVGLIEEAYEQLMNDCTENEITKKDDKDSDQEGE